MDIRALVWFGFVFTCMLATSVDSVIPPFIQERAKLNNKKKPFKPTAQKCCRIGQRTAKKKMSCSTSGQRTINRSIQFKLKVQGKLARTEKRTRKLKTRIAICARDFFKTFYKCCTYRESYYQQLKLCKRKHKRKRDRRKCKKLLKKKYS